MTKYLIIEDERLSCQELKRMISHLRPGYRLEELTGNITRTAGEEELAAALDKYEQIHRPATFQPIDYRQLEKIMFRKQDKERFLVQKKDAYSYVESGDIAFFYSEDKVVFIHTFSNERYIIGYTLELLEKQLSTDRFFRVSRNCISNIKAIKTIEKYFNGRLKLTFHPQCPHEILVSRVRVGNFLQWIDGIVSK